jgi:RHS repeat-associated protein
MGLNKNAREMVHPNLFMTLEKWATRQVTFGSSDYDTFTYDVSTGRLNQYKFYVGATPQTVTSNLTWNANGSLGSLAITDQLNSANTQTCNYSHDDLGRIATANCGTIWNQSFGFDPFGNISKSATAGISFLPTYSQSTNRYSSVPGCTPSYDANGFATNDCAHTYSWDSEGNPRIIDSVSLSYDALGRMVEQARGTTYTQIVYGPGGGKLALMNGATLSKAFVPLPGGGAAAYTSSSLTYYRHPDWLGSGRLATTPTAPTTLYYDMAYAPYGEGYAPSGAVDLDFTGQTQDTVSGLYDFLFREYNANQGRWPWPDPAGMGAVNMGNPQTWNRYAYVGNTPLTATDPLGLLSRWSDVVGTGRWLGTDGLRDPGGAWFGAIMQAWAIFNSPSFSGQVQYLASIPQNWQYVPTSTATGINGSGLYEVDQTTGYWKFDGFGSDTRPANESSWAWNFTKSFFSGFSLQSARVPGESRTQCVSRVRSAGGSFTGAVDAVSGVGTVSTALTARVGTTTYSTAAYYWGPEMGVKAVTMTKPNLSLLEGVATSAAGYGFISPGTASLVSKVAAPVAKVSGLATAVALGLEGGVVGACR